MNYGDAKPRIGKTAGGAASKKRRLKRGHNKTQGATLGLLSAKMGMDGKRRRLSTMG